MARQHARKDWAALKAAYRRGEGTVAALAPRFGIAHSTAEKRCAREKWQVERQEVGRRAEARAAESDVESVASMLSKHRRISSRANALIERALAGEHVDVSVAKLERLMAAFVKAARQERLAAGIEPSKPVAGGGGSPKSRIVVRGGAAVPAVVPALVESEKKAS